MNIIHKKPLSSLGYGFVADQYIPKGKDEYYLRNIQNRSGIKYRRLSAYETEVLVRNGNTSDNWDNIKVSDSFNPELVKNCQFHGLVRIGKLEPYFLEFNNIRMPVGLYNSNIISCDFGDNVVIDNVNFISHYIIGNEVIIVNVNEIATTNHSKFGNGILKQGEKESVRVWIEVCNENAGRSILPFNGMQPGDAWMWSKFRDDEKLLQKFLEFTEKKFDKKRGYYGKIGDRTVIKNCSIIKDVWIGSDAYIKGANKMKNLTINSSPEAKTQIGEGCELVNGIIGYNCRIFYGVKAVRFFLASNSQLKYGARLINSYLGDNSTISCCEVLNSLIFPSHEQHHNNSFLCAATVMGQSNMAAGATIGSNHNSRGADGELVAGRGFWPGLCVSLKHNSKFASFTLIAKGDFPAELNIPIPFSLISNDVSNDQLIVMPAYWFMYNMYALARNEGKYEARDNRTEAIQKLEFNYLAPDSVNEMFEGMELMKKYTATAISNNKKKTKSEDIERLLMEGKLPENVKIYAEGFENTSRKVLLLKVPQAYASFARQIRYYAATQLVNFIERKNINSFQALLAKLPKNTDRGSWMNLGGQLVPLESFKTFVSGIHRGKINGWDDVHSFYATQGSKYEDLKLQHAWASLLEINRMSPSKFSAKVFSQLLDDAIATRKHLTDCIRSSREKDYESPFRQMVYDTEKEMEKVLGKLSDNSFIKLQEEETKEFERRVMAIRKNFRV